MDTTPYEDMMSWCKKQLGTELYDASQLLENVEFMNMCAKNLQKIGINVKEYIKQFAVDIKWCLKFRREGEKVFQVSRDLVRALSETSCEADVDLIKLPYNAFMLQVPEGSLGMTEYLQIMKQDNILVVLFKDFGVGQFLPGLKSRHQGYYHLEIPESGVWKEPKETISIDNRPDKDGQAGVHFSSILIEVHRFVVNFLLYLNSMTPDLEEQEPERPGLEIQLAGCKTKQRNKRRKIRNRINPDESRLGFIVVGRGYKPKDDGTREKNQLDKRFRVRGHWRKQPYGPRKKPEYKAIWIEPHWKGPDKAEVLNRRYKVQ